MNGNADQRLRISVIVTNYNYGHFLGPCLDSLRSQTKAPDEIVVINDGSDDGSLEYLEKQGDIKVISQANGGQASAFNAGFSATIGEAVIFLDADDVLYSHAIELVHKLWTGNNSVLCYCLDTIDVRGQKVGLYDQKLPDSDLFPRLIKDLRFPFMPTSGNVFSRKAIAWAFPLPEENWRICTDALLIRCALLTGPIRNIDQVLGGYRLHENNNYFRSVSNKQWSTVRGLRTVASIGPDLISLCDRAGHSIQLGHRVRILISGLRAHLEADALSPQREETWNYLKKLPSKIRLNQNPRLHVLFRLLTFGLRYSKRWRFWLISPLTRPRLVESLVYLALGERLRNQLSGFAQPRAIFLSPTLNSAEQELDLPSFLTSPEWFQRGNIFSLQSKKGRFALRRLPGAAAQLLISTETPDKQRSNVSVFLNSEIQLKTVCSGKTELRIALNDSFSGKWEEDLIEISVEDIPEKSNIRQLFRRDSSRIAITKLKIEELEPPTPVLVFPVSASGQVSTIRAPIDGGKHHQTNGLRTGSNDITLNLAVPPLSSPFCLLMNFSCDQQQGELAVFLGDNNCIFEGLVGASSTALMEIPALLIKDQFDLNLQLRFSVSSAIDHRELKLETVGWLPGGRGSQEGYASLLPGEKYVPSNQQINSTFMGLGWRSDSEGRCILDHDYAELNFSRASLNRSSLLYLDLEPLNAAEESTAPILTLTINGSECRKVFINSRGNFGFALNEAPLGSGESVKVGLRLSRNRNVAQISSRSNAVILHSVWQGIQRGSSLAPRALVPERGNSPDIVDYLKQLESMLRDSASDSELLQIRARLLSELSPMLPEAIANFLSANDLRNFSKLNLILGASSETPDFVSASWDKTPESWIKFVSLAMLSGPAQAHFCSIKLSAFPVVPPNISRAISEYIASGLDSETRPEDLKQNRDFLVQKLEEARSILADSPIESAHWKLCAEFLSAVDISQLLITELDLKPLAEAIAKATEVKLLRQGHQITLSDYQSEDRRPTDQIGFVLKHIGPSPETWFIQSVLKPLSDANANILIFLTGNEIDGPLHVDGAQVVDLTGRSTAETVMAIRRANLDSLVICTKVFGHEKITEIVTHRMARRQILLSSFNPVTTGLQSVDDVIIGELIAKETTSREFSERAVNSPSVGTSFDISSIMEFQHAKRDLVRQRFGATEGNVVLITGAHVSKLNEELLDGWMNLLSNSPNTLLVLFPFANNWEMPFEEARFARRLKKACTKYGVEDSRIRLWRRVPNVQVPELLLAADIYLDSFPYAGSATVYEALRCGLPVVSKSGKALRNNRSEGWLKLYGLEDLVSISDEEYFNTALELIESEEKRQSVSARIKVVQDEGALDTAFSDWFVDYLGEASLKRPDEFRYLFHHLPKTGGTSLTKIFNEWFEMVRDYREPWASAPPEPALDLSTIGKHQMIAGHFAADQMPLNYRYPETLARDKWRRITFVRDPLERAISEYFFERKIRANFDPTFEMDTLSNFVRDRSGDLIRHFECNEDNWREALDRYWFIGTLERLPDCLRYLSAELNKPLDDAIPHENSTERNQLLSSEDAARFRENNKIDYEIYEEISRRLERRLACYLKAQ